MSNVPKDASTRARELASLIVHHRKQYHEKDAPEISDEAYDSLVSELSVLKAQYPALTPIHTETDTVGGRPDDAFMKVIHRVRQWSFDNVFTDDELIEWEARLLRFLEKEGVHEKKLRT